MNTKNWIISAVVLAVLAVGVLFILDSKKGINIIPQQGGEPSETMLENQSKEAAQATQALINEAKDKLPEQESPSGTDGTEDINNPATGPDAAGQPQEDQPAETVEVIRNTSPINVETGEVVNDAGDKVDTSEDAAIEDAAKVSGAISEEDLPESGIKLRMYIDKIEPAQFTVQAGQAINLAVIGMDDHFHSFNFKDDELGGMFMSVVQGEVRSITFNVPDKPGEYEFYDAMNNYEQRGANGIMIVQ